MLFERFVSRTSRRFVGAFDRALARRFSRRHPGSAERFLLSALRPLVLRCAIDDKWNLKWFVPRVLKGLRAPSVPPPPETKHIFIFCAYRIEFTLNLALAVLLAWRGHRITIGYLPKLQSPIDQPLKRDDPSAKSWLRYALADVAPLSGGRISVVDLSEASACVSPTDEVFVDDQAFYDVIMALGRETIDLDDAQTRYVYDYMRTIGREGLACARAHFASHQYDLCLVPNGATFEGAHVLRAASGGGLPVNTLEKFAFKNARVVNHGSDATSWVDLDQVWRRRAELGYLEKAVLDTASSYALRLMDDRRRNSTSLWAWSLQTTGPQSPNEALRALGLPPGTTFVLVAANVPYDAGYARLRSLFPTMRQWLVDTVQVLLESSSLTVVVRAHPGEAAHWGGNERSDENLARAGLVSDRLVVVPAEMRVNTYALMEAAEFGAVFSSTIGLEMAMIGKRVLVGSNVYYAGRGFTEEGVDANDYFAKLRALAAGGAAPLHARATAAARLFYFLIHFAMQQPYPYDKPSGIRAVPPGQLLAQPGATAFVETLDALALERSEFLSSLPRYYGARSVLSRLPALD